MSQEKIKLTGMLKEKKITEKEYQLLSKALERNAGQPVYAWFINPFQKIAGIKAALFGMIMLIALSTVGMYANIYYSSILDCLNAGSLPYTNAVKPGFILLLTQNINDVLVLSMLFFITSLLMKQKRIRLIDFLGTVALSRFPYLVLSIFIAIFWKIDPQIMTFNPTEIYQHHFTITGLLVNWIWGFCYAWQITTYIFAFKESSGLNGTKLWIGFVLSLLFGDALSREINTYFMFN